MAGHHVWRARVPLLCFHIVEWHFPDRARRQFGGRQGIPNMCDTENELHELDLRGKWEINWARRHAAYVAMWADRHDRVVTINNEEEVDVHPEYMPWYRRITRRFIGRNGLMLGYVVHDICYNFIIVDFGFTFRLTLFPTQFDSINDLDQHARAAESRVSPYVQRGLAQLQEVLTGNIGIQMYPAVDEDPQPPVPRPRRGRGGQVRGRRHPARHSPSPTPSPDPSPPHLMPHPSPHYGSQPLAHPIESLTFLTPDMEPTTGEQPTPLAPQKQRSHVSTFEVGGPSGHVDLQAQFDAYGHEDASQITQVDQQVNQEEVRVFRRRRTRRRG